MDLVYQWMRLGRFHFLTGGIILNLLGIAIALYNGAVFNPTAALWGQIAITATQLMTHYANDTFDLAADRANRTPTNWSGGSRVLIEGRLSPRAALTTALVFAGLALFANVILSLFITRHAGMFLLLLTAQAAAWFYSAPPIRLHSRGVGELATTFIVPFLTPLTGYFLQVGQLDLLPILAVIPLCCLQFAMILSIEFPDAEGDRYAGKRTLVVRFGAVKAARLYTAALGLADAILPALIWLGLPWLAALAGASLCPLAIFQVWRVYRGDWRKPERWNRFSFYSIVLLMSTAAAELGAFILLIGTR